MDNGWKFDGLSLQELDTLDELVVITLEMIDQLPTEDQLEISHKTAQIVALRQALAWHQKQREEASSQVAVPWRDPSQSLAS